MVQEPQTEEKSQVTLTRLAEFAGNMKRIDRQTRLLGIDGVTGMDTRVNGHIGLLRIARVTKTMTQVGR
jgi:hypothetical protein